MQKKQDSALLLNNHILCFSAVRDGDKERVAVGHHLGDRAHYIEKKRDKDGRFRQNHKFVNMDQGLVFCNLFKFPI